MHFASPGAGYFSHEDMMTSRDGFMKVIYAPVVMRRSRHLLDARKGLATLRHNHRWMISCSLVVANCVVQGAFGRHGDRLRFLLTRRIRSIYRQEGEYLCTRRVLGRLSRCRRKVPDVRRVNLFDSLGDAKDALYGDRSLCP